MKAFFKDQIEKKFNPSSSFERILLRFGDVQQISQLEWDYTPRFIGFRRFLNENSIFLKDESRQNDEWVVLMNNISVYDEEVLMNDSIYAQSAAAFSFISINTMRKHNTNLRRKLEIGSQEALMLYIDLLRHCDRLAEITVNNE